MRRLLTCLCILYVLTSSAQKYSEDQRQFNFKNNMTYEIKYENTDYAYLEISKNAGHLQNSIKTIEFTDIKQDADLISFGDYINDVRKFIIIKARYSFYILNLYNNKLIGPFKPKFYGIGDDSQSSMLAGMRIILDGRFIIGYCVDSGPFVYDLTYLYSPHEAIPASNIYVSSNNIFILEHLDKQDLYFGLFLAENGWEIKEKIIFTYKHVEALKQIQNENLSEKEIEDLNMNTDPVDNKFTTLKEKINQKIEYKTYDNYTGKEVIMPLNINRSDLSAVKGYLKQISIN